ncbi:MAG: 4-(cytidine 5'-diphospho)-2-C-methyl-D-erythritol kinase [Oscillospiraceae bacterium]
MKELCVKAYAKLNLSLDVLGAMGNGYHEMRMVMQSVTLADDVSIRLTDSGTVALRTNLGFLPNDERNIAAKAARLFFAEAGMEGAGAEIRLHKRVPVGAGLGGGSSDAAAVLRGLNEMTGTGFSREKLERLGARLGSDVPFCVAGGTQLASGRGDELRDLPPLPDCPIVICKPPFPIQTPALFACIDSRRSRIHPDTEGLLAALDGGDLVGLARRMYNVFEDVLPRRCAEIGQIKSRFLDLGALGTVMSGTGSAVFALFDSEALAEQARAELGRSYRECFLTRPLGRIL